MTTGERIRYYCERKGMTLKELGEKADFLNREGCAHRTVLECARVPKVDTLEKIEEALDVPVDALCYTETTCMKCKSFRLEQLQEYRKESIS